jgi:poly(ADP-ribose) glycohydrolase
MNDGCVQEEIRFVICPEMLISLLLCEVIQSNECVFLIGCERFSSYQGYSISFQYREDFIDQTPK